MKTIFAPAAIVLILGFMLAGCSSSKDSVSASNSAVGDQVKEAIVHAREAEKYGTNGDARELVVHAEAALNFAKQAQNSEPNREHLRQATEALGQAIEEGRKGDASLAARRVHNAIIELLQAEDQARSSVRPASQGSGK